MAVFSRPLKVAVLLSSSEGEGGAFVQSLNIARLLAPRSNASYEVEYIAIDKSDRERLRKSGLPVSESVGTMARNLVDVLDHLPRIKSILRQFYMTFFKQSAWLDKFAHTNGFDVLVFTSNSRQAMNVKRTPFIFTVWDICHLDHPEFPEYTSDNSFAWRENLYKSVLPRASAYIVDTEQFADRLARTYCLDRSKAIVIPYQASQEILRASIAEPEIANLRRKYGLTKPFVFYPAQFWPHKNHVYVLRALKVLIERQMNVDAVFSGANRGALGRIRKIAEAQGLTDCVKFVGFLPTEEIAQMYRAASVAIMPSYFGPTNIPPLEAEALGCHFIYSDLPGYREFAGPDCLYCDLTRPEHLADLIAQAMARPPRKPMARPVDADHISAKWEKTLLDLSAKIAAWNN